MSTEEPPPEPEILGLTQAQVGGVFLIFILVLMVLCCCGWGIVIAFH